MDLSKAFKSGAMYVRDVVSKFRGASGQVDTPKQADSCSGLEHIVSFPTGENSDPLDVKFRLFKLSGPWGENAHRILIETKNARHPYDKKCQFGYFGKEIMNPALLSALDKIEQVLNQAVTGQMHDSTIQKSANECRQGSLPQVKGNMDGVELWITLNTKDCAKEAKYENVVQLYQALVTSVKENAPVIQNHINQSMILQPLPKPSAEMLFAFDSEISEAMMRAIAEVSKLPAGTQFILPDGTKRGLIKGLDP